jgi:subtilase family serine protease
MPNGKSAARLGCMTDDSGGRLGHSGGMRTSGALRRAAVAALAGCVVAGAVIGAPGIARAASVFPLPGSAVPAASAGAQAGAAPAAQALTVQVWLTPDLAGATALAAAVSTPGSSEFHRYLSPDAYTAQFGSPAPRAAAVAAWLAGSGLTQVHADRGRDYVSATGPVAKIQSAFQVRINRYRVTGANGRPAVIESNDRAVSVPAALAPDVLGVTGLNTAPPVTAPAVPAAATGLLKPVATTATCSRYWAQYVKSFRPAYRGLTTGALPVCGYHASQIRAAYGAQSASTGTGQTVALIEDEEPVAMFQTLTDYAKGSRLPVPRSAQFREQHIDAGGTCGSSARAAAQRFYPDEEQMDSEALYAMAPGANQLMVIGGGCNEDQDLLDAALAVLTGNGGHPSASIESNSWQIPLGVVPAATVHALALRAAVEGVGLYFASGDTPDLTVTDSDPYVTAVGGTTLGLGAKNNRVFETGWSDDFAYLDGGKWTDVGLSGGGGGTSLVYEQPAYQKGVVPAAMAQIRVGTKLVTDRTVPDLAADADPDSGFLTGYIGSGTSSHPGPYQTELNAGTSLATPLIAGLVADAQQGQPSPFGFVNPLLYQLAGTSALHDILPVTAALPPPDRAAYEAPSDGSVSGVDVFDSQERPATGQVTAKGYDTMTGIGTPNGAAFIAGLRRAASR